MPDKTIHLNQLVKLDDGSTGAILTIEARRVVLAGQDHGEVKWVFVGNRTKNDMPLPNKWFSASQIVEHLIAPPSYAEQMSQLG